MILISGHKSFIGRNLVNHLKASNTPFYTLDPISPFHYNCRTLIHLSASTNVRQSILDPIKNFELNCRRTLDLLNFALINRFNKFIFISSASSDYPHSPYLASKSACEAYCKAFFKSYGLKTYIIRPSNVYGPFSEFKNSVIPRFIKSYLQNKKFYIYGDGEQTRDFVYVSDLFETILNPQQPTSVISSGISTSINRLIDIFYSLGVQPKIDRKPAQKGEVRHSAPTPSITTTTNLKEGLISTFNYLKWHYTRS